jgi:peptide chain release factor 1
LIIQPDVISDQEIESRVQKFKSIGREAWWVRAYYGNIEEANEIIADNSDADMTEMAKMQLEEAKKDYQNWWNQIYVDSKRSRRCQELW